MSRVPDDRKLGIGSISTKYLIQFISSEIFGLKTRTRTVLKIIQKVMARKKMAIKRRNSLSSNIHPSFIRKSSLMVTNPTGIRPGFESLPSNDYYNQNSTFDHFSEIESMSDEENDTNDMHAGDLATSIAVNILRKHYFIELRKKSNFRNI